MLSCNIHIFERLKHGGKLNKNQMVFIVKKSIEFDFKEC